VEAIQLLDKLTERTAPGRTPGFNPAYTLKTLHLIQDGPIGRKQLSEILNLGEGVVRTIVKRLIEEDLVSTSRLGMELTSKGISLVIDIGRNIYGVEFPQTELTVSQANYAVLIRNGSIAVSTGLHQRDTALLAGAKGATTLVFKGNRLKIPGVGTRISEDIQSMIKNKLNPSDGDAIIIGSADKLLHAEIGAYSAALKLLS
jgi:predicted transcriptional regulator